MDNVRKTFRAVRLTHNMKPLTLVFFMLSYEIISIMQDRTFLFQQN
jgi:hypothetical protein